MKAKEADRREVYDQPLHITCFYTTFDSGSSFTRSKLTRTVSHKDKAASKKFENIYRLWGDLLVVPASTEYHEVFDEMKKAKFYASITLSNTL